MKNTSLNQMTLPLTVQHELMFIWVSLHADPMLPLLHLLPTTVQFTLLYGPETGIFKSLPNYTEVQLKMRTNELEQV